MLSLIAFLILRKTLKERFADNLRIIKNKFGNDIAKNLERLYRLETNHFKSGQFRHTYSPGMESFGTKYPFGWKTIASIFWNSTTLARPVGFYSGTEGKTGKTKTFLKFPSLLAAMLTVATFLKHYDNNPGRWYSTNLESQQRYNNSINKIKTPIYDSIS